MGYERTKIQSLEDMVIEEPERSRLYETNVYENTWTMDKMIQAFTGRKVKASDRGKTLFDEYNNPVSEDNVLKQL